MLRHLLFNHRDDLIPSAPHVSFGDELILTGADPGEGMAEAGDSLRIALRWQAQQEMERDYSLSLRLVDEEKHLWGQQDKLLENTFTSHWVKDAEVVVRAHTSQWASGEEVILRKTLHREYLIRGDAMARGSRPVEFLQQRWVLR